MNTKKILKAIGLMAVGGILTIAELVRELTIGGGAQKNRDALRLTLDGYENETLKVTVNNGHGFGVTARPKHDDYESVVYFNEEDASE